MKTYLQNGSENRQFSKGRSFTSRGLLMQKSVFLTGHVLRDVSMFLQNWLIRWFQPMADAFTVPPKNRVTDASTQWRNWSKIRRRSRDAPTHKFKRRPHKSPSGKYFYSTGSKNEISVDGRISTSIPPTLWDGTWSTIRYGRNFTFIMDEDLSKQYLLSLKVTIWMVIMCVA